ncbi:hypothetical protein AK812_SmicGene43958 [Symbiodinium microadriaticum]|uniref:Uncharacterized protein n=1 Tax=Symbiodinium microadriaticum TaxID=2951 RepID=A0A1Q9BZP4_SYMMI|nr:hypothetical protein AK812_SmicGene43958 [Symbiodinium microadriaticum]
MKREVNELMHALTSRSWYFVGRSRILSWDSGSVATGCRCFAGSPGVKIITGSLEAVCCLQLDMGNNGGDAKAVLCCGSVPKAEAEKGARLIANTLVCWLHNAVEKVCEPGFFHGILPLDFNVLLHRANFSRDKNSLQPFGDSQFLVTRLLGCGQVEFAKGRLAIGTAKLRYASSVAIEEEAGWKAGEESADDSLLAYGQYYKYRTQSGKWGLADPRLWLLRCSFWGLSRWLPEDGCRDRLRRALLRSLRWLRSLCALRRLYGSCWHDAFPRHGTYGSWWVGASAHYVVYGAYGNCWPAASPLLAGGQPAFACANGAATPPRVEPLFHGLCSLLAQRALIQGTARAWQNSGEASASNAVEGTALGRAG